uniref:Protein zwilch n=1 Tax=Hucho hucho TaxID=62062 RepID=A0A4W5LLE0_9TELE
IHYVTVLLCDKAPQIDPEDEIMDESRSDDETNHKVKIELGPQPLTIMKARQLLSRYTMSQNSIESPAVSSAPLLPLWVRCDMADPAGTTWLGAETACTGDKVSGVKLYSVTCAGSTVDKATFITLDELKQEHKKRHHPSMMVARGTAQYNLFGSTVVENTTIESQSSVTVDFRWSHVESILETPPLSSTATLNIKVSSGDMRSPMYPLYRELEFLQVCAKNNTSKCLFSPNYDFSCVTSYQDVGDCLKLVIKALQYGDVKPWIHRDSSSSLSKLILQSYHHQMDHVSLTGLTPVHMLLEMGLDKMRKDYINYLIGQELTTLNHLSYYLSTVEDLQEQVIRLRKLHHLLEITVTCSTFLGLVLTCCTLYNHWDYYYLTLLVIYERLNILSMFCYNLHPAQPEEDWPTPHSLVPL